MSQESLYFSLSTQIPQEKIIKEIINLISKNVKSKEEAESSILVIKVQKVSQDLDFEIPKLTY